VLIARAPLRVSYAGGGTDIESYYRAHDGVVVSVAIDKYFYVFITPIEARSLQISSADYRAFRRLDVDGEPHGVGGELKHAEAACRHMGINGGYSVFMASQVPSGTGLGSSSAAAVALVKGLSTLLRRPLTKAELAQAACEIELTRLQMPIGRQDQYASTFGGLNAISFSASGVQVEPLEVTPGCRATLETWTMLFYTGLTHDSAQILRDQQERMRDTRRSNLDALHEIRAAAHEMRDALLADCPEQVGPILDRGWQAKKRLSDCITNAAIDAAYEAALAAGALGGKIAGAGGGGFLMLYCPPDRQPEVTARMNQVGLVRADFHFDFSGARVLMNNVAD
jgi:D-glycero-alpha-D-manno-heptose-7-phosphate kinase